MWAYLKEVIGIDITDVCPRVAKEEPVLKTSNGDLVARMVPLSHKNELGPIFNNDVIFLVNSVNIVFNSLSAGVEKEGTKILQSFKFKLDGEHNLYLVGADTDLPLCDKAIAVVKIE